MLQTFSFKIIFLGFFNNCQTVSNKLHYLEPNGISYIYALYKSYPFMFFLYQNNLT